MADESQLETLKQGPKIWNAWRKQTLGSVNLREATLRGANLGRADLSWAEAQAAIADDWTVAYVRYVLGE